jgi:thiol-disulfide isomerase/thioredoxin
MREVESEEELEKILKSPDRVVIFYFMDTCGFCQKMHEPYDELEKDHKDVKFVKVETKHIPKKLGKDSFPDFELREGKEVKAKAKGAMEKKELEKELFGGSGVGLAFANGGRRRRRTRTRRLRRRTVKRLH